MHEQLYRVVWKIDEYAYTPRAAAKRAVADQRRLETVATVYDVVGMWGLTTRVDLTETETGRDKMHQLVAESDRIESEMGKLRDKLDRSEISYGEFDERVSDFNRDAAAALFALVVELRD